jgi:hypothetical protein
LLSSRRDGRERNTDFGKMEEEYFSGKGLNEWKRLKG